MGPHPWKSRRVAEPNLKLLGERLREARKALGWTQEEFADKAGIDRSYAGGIERGERNITFTMLCQLCRALGCEAGTIAEGLPVKGKE
jgi:transcriptional regulator with XRE-family HTH domain